MTDTADALSPLDEAGISALVDEGLAAIAAAGESLARRKARARQGATAVEDGAEAPEAATAQEGDDAVDPQATSRKEGQE